MAVTSTVLDGNNVALAFAGSFSADAFTLNTSSYLPASWCSILRQNALKLFGVTTLAQRATVGFLDRLIAIGSLDGTTITTSAVGAGTVALRVTVNANTTVLVQLPHSIFGAASLGQSVPATGGGGGGSVVASDLGLVRWTTAIDGAVFPGAAVAIRLNTGIGNLVLADSTDPTRMPCIGFYALDSALNSCVRTSGEQTSFSPSGPVGPGDVLYVSTAGTVSGLPPTAPGSSRQVIGSFIASGFVFVQPGFVEVV